MIIVIHLDLVSQVHETDVRKYIADLISLPMVPKHRVRQAFDINSQQLCSEYPIFKSFILYVRRTFINNKRYTIDTWNHFDFLGIRPRTNNHVEGCHRQLKRFKKTPLLFFASAFIILIIYYFHH